VLCVGDYRTIGQQYEERNMMPNTSISWRVDSKLQLGDHRFDSNEIQLYSIVTVVLLVFVEANSILLGLSKNVT
jgi:hypothetical protein